MSAPIRVAHVAGTAERTGVGSHLIAFLSSFDRAEVEPTLFLPGPGPLSERMKELNVPVEFIAPRSLFAFGEEAALAKRWRGAFDVVHAHGPRPSFWAARAARRAQVPAFVLTIHEMRWLTLPPSVKRWAWITLEERAFAAANRIITLAETMREEVGKRYPHWADRLRTVHGTAPLLLEADRLPLADLARGAGDAVRLVCVARFDWFKGYDILIESLGRLAKRGVNFTFDVAGDGPTLEATRARAAELGIADRIHWLGQITDVVSLLQRSHLYVLATRAEGLPVAVLEAMALGLPVVGTRASGMGEAVLHGENGLLVDLEPDATRADRLGDAIETLARDPALAARMGTQSAERARTAFSPKRLAAETAAVYREALGRRA